MPSQLDEYDLWPEADDDEEDEDDEESRLAVDRVLKKYTAAKVMEDDKDDFDARYEMSIKDKMAEWKRTYVGCQTRGRCSATRSKGWCPS